MRAPEFKVSIVGDGGVGKTTFIQRFITGEFGRRYVSTQSTEVHPFVFYTNHGPIRLQIWDTAGQQKLGGLRQGYYIGSHASILMFDVTSRMTYKNLMKWYRDVTRVCENIPVVIVGNKVDQKDRKVKPHQITFQHKHKLPYFDVSAKLNYQYELPFLWILRALVGDSNLYLIDRLPLRTPQIQMDQQTVDKLLDDWNKVGRKSLPNQDEDEFF